MHANRFVRSQPFVLHTLWDARKRFCSQTKLLLVELRSHEVDLHLNKTYFAPRAVGIYYFRVHSFIEQIALVRQLSKFVAEHPKVKLVVIDSIGAE
jgi:hypothetical protein